jgi:hypothetical protein
VPFIHRTGCAVVSAGFHAATEAFALMRRFVPRQLDAHWAPSWLVPQPLSHCLVWPRLHAAASSTHTELHTLPELLLLLR